MPSECQTVCINRHNLGPNCLQRLSAMIKVATSKERVNTSDMSRFFIICVENIGITIKGILGIVITVSYHSSFSCGMFGTLYLRFIILRS